jgi:RimJ/RimL family protein N-acetyltransferase
LGEIEVLKRDLFKSERLLFTGKYPEDQEVLAGWHEDSFYLRNVDTDMAFPIVPGVFNSDENGDNTHHSFRIRLLEDGRLIGFAALHGIEWNNGMGDLSIGIGNPLDRGKGYGSEALKLLLQFAFLELNLHRIGLDVISYNEPAIRSYIRSGFSEEGRVREAIYREGKRYDRIYMGLLKQEWLALEGN